MKKTNHNSKYKRLNTGITLIALVVTIVIMLILAAVTINVTIEGGIFGHAQGAKKSVEDAEEREKIEIAIINAKAKDRNGKLTSENLQKELSEAEIHEETGSIIAKMNGIYYEVDENEEIWILDAKTEKKLTIICVDSDEKEIAQKEYTILKSNYSLTAPKIEDYEPSEEKLVGEISENKEIKVTYYKIFDDDTELVFTGLDSSGAITTEESEIVSYMVGDGTTKAGNGLKEKNMKGILKIPETYKRKPVTKISGYAFRGMSYLTQVIIGDNVEVIERYFSFADLNITEVTIGKRIINLGEHTFYNCQNLEKVIFKNSMIEYGDFVNAVSWTKIEIDKDNKDYMVKDNVLYSYDGKVLIKVPSGLTGEFVVPDTVEKISGSAFASTNITKVIISDNVTDILKYFAFGNSLKEVVIGKKIKEINGYAFYNCSKLEVVTINSPIIAGLINSNSACGDLLKYPTTVYIKNTITTIGKYIADNFITETSDKDGYIKYVKK